tara:strand:+ start:2532 stop:2684 length:153 start_codon:yes stop_codon:yes gene_type:complete
MHWEQKILENILDVATSKKPIKRSRGSIRDKLSPTMQKVWDKAQARKKNK